MGNETVMRIVIISKRDKSSSMREQNPLYIQVSSIHRNEVRGNGNRTGAPYMPSYANTIGRHSDPYPTVSDQAYSFWRISWL